MHIARLSLTHFRSWPDLALAAGPGLIVLAGDNGAGKTNILEALSMLSPGRGLRQAPLRDMAAAPGPGGFGIAARLSAGADIGTGTLADHPDRRQVRINGATAAANGLSEWLAFVWLTPAMDRLFLEGSSGRRRFLDRLVLALEPRHAHHAARYEAAMRNRNKLLSEPERADPVWLDALEAAMAEHGAEMARARTQVVQALNGRLATLPDAPFARADIMLEGEDWTDGQALVSALKMGRNRDSGAGRTLAGPHRTDMIVSHAAKVQAAARCSTGEQKALLLGMVLAHADIVAEARGQRPILLLDEVAAHLDPVRRKALFARLDEAGGQVWMTGTEASLFQDAPESRQLLRIGAGKVERAA